AGGGGPGPARRGFQERGGFGAFRGEPARAWSRREAAGGLRSGLAGRKRGRGWAALDFADDACELLRRRKSEDAEAGDQHADEKGQVRDRAHRGQPSSWRVVFAIQKLSPAKAVATRPRNAQNQAKPMPSARCVAS